jgi:protein-disulfide isomerase
MINRHLYFVLAIIFVLAASFSCSSNAVGSGGPATEIQKSAAIDFVSKLVMAQAPQGMPPQVTFDEELPSQLAGFNQLKMRVKMGRNIQTISLFVSADSKLAIPAGAVMSIESGKPSSELQDESYTELEPGALDLTNQPTRGPEDAKVTVVVISDFQCPACRHYNEMYEKTIAPQFGDKIKTVFLNFPLERIHPWAMSAAIATECVYNQKPEAFWKLHDKFFENQSEIVPTNLVDKVISFVDGEGIDTAALATCIEEKQTENAVKADMSQGNNIGLRGTPTYIVNNKLLNSGLTPQAIEQALAEAK